MAKDKLVIVNGRYYFRLQWLLAEEDDLGAIVGDRVFKKCNSDEPLSREDYECNIAEKVAKESGAARDNDGYYWETVAAAKAVLRKINVAMAQERPLPDWANQALADGWKPPKGWKA